MGLMVGGSIERFGGLSGERAPATFVLAVVRCRAGQAAQERAQALLGVMLGADAFPGVLVAGLVSPVDGKPDTDSEAWLWGIDASASVTPPGDRRLGDCVELVGGCRVVGSVPEGGARVLLD